jgi:two-component system, LytTR family, sensor kinase
MSHSNALAPSRITRVAVVLAMVALVLGGWLVAASGEEAMVGRGPLFRRIPAPPTNIGEMLRAFGVGSVSWFACALAVSPLWWLAYRWPLAQERPGRAATLQLAAVVLLLALTTVAHYFVSYRGSPMAPPFMAFVPIALASSAVPLFAVAAMVNVLEGRRRAMRGAIEEQRLRAELAESRLAGVTMQLHPHFLFNTLQSISTLIHRDPVGADAMLGKLSELLREILRRSNSALVPLGDELRMAEAYLDLAKIRHGERLRVQIDVPESVRTALVPVLLLQPLRENALRHGVGRRATGGCVGITVRDVVGELALHVWDDGVGLDEDETKGDGVGLTNTRERLRHAFGGRQRLTLGARDGGGVDVEIRIPFTVGSVGST